MDWITDTIAIGNFVDAQDLELIRREKIVSALSLNGTLHGRPASAFGLRRVETVLLEDAKGNDPKLFIRAVDLLDKLVIEAPPVLVQCHAGRSRSVIVVAGHLIRARGFTPDEAIAYVAARRDVAVTAGVELLLDYL